MHTSINGCSFHLLEKPIEKKVLLNKNRILEIKKNSDDEDTSIKLNEGSTLKVKESYEEIRKMLND